MNSPLTPSRRQLMKTLAGIGIGSAIFQRAVVAQAPKEGAITVDMIEKAEWITGFKLTEDQRKALVRGINNSQRGFERLRKIATPNDLPPAFAFIPSTARAEPGHRGKVEPTSSAV